MTSATALSECIGSFCELGPLTPLIFHSPFSLTNLYRANPTIPLPLVISAETSATSPTTSSFEILIALIPPSCFSSSEDCASDCFIESMPCPAMKLLDIRVIARSISPRPTALTKSSTTFEGLRDQLQELASVNRPKTARGAMTRELFMRRRSDRFLYGTIRFLLSCGQIDL